MYKVLAVYKRDISTFFNGNVQIGKFKAFLGKIRSV